MTESSRNARRTSHAHVVIRTLLGAMPGFVVAQSAHSEPTDQVSCYQQGTLIYKSPDKTSAGIAAMPDGALKLIADFSNDQTREVRTRIYANTSGTLVCVVTTQR